QPPAIVIASQGSIGRVFRAIGAQGPIDGLVNNAAMATGVGGKNMIDYEPDLGGRGVAGNGKGTWVGAPGGGTARGGGGGGG
ncbi:hypothetical protein M8371_33135, partial [Klebsiella pneumoniae]|nr:hypothetical protein [Klebsiella pneumoniae]